MANAGYLTIVVERSSGGESTRYPVLAGHEVVLYIRLRSLWLEVRFAPGLRDVAIAHVAAPTACTDDLAARPRLVVTTDVEACGAVAVTALDALVTYRAWLAVRDGREVAVGESALTKVALACEDDVRIYVTRRAIINATVRRIAV